MPRALLVAAAAAVISAADDHMTWSQASCVLKGRKLAYFGDSQSRFCYYGLNAFLGTGALRSREFSDADDGNLGDGPGSDDYDGVESWNANGLLRPQAAHRMHAWATFDDFRTDYWFIQGVWWDGQDETAVGRDGFAIRDVVRNDTTLADVARTLDADYVVYNMGWWQLLDGFTDYKCGRGAASRGRDDASRDAGTTATRRRRDWSDACEAW